MSSIGLEQRAAGVGVILSPLRPRQPPTDQPDAVVANLAWPATQVLAELLSASQKEGVLTRDEADTILRRSGCNLATFESRGWLRWILGRFEFPMGVGIAIAGQESGRSLQGIDQDELRALAPLRTRIYAYAEAKPVLPKSQAESILARYHGAPTLEALAQRGVLQLQGEDVALDLRANLWASFGDRIAAVLWISGPTASDLSQWMIRVPQGWWMTAPAHLTADQRSRLLDEMMDALEREADLKDYAQEVNHIAPDVGSPSLPVRRIDPPRDTQIARFMWWHSLHIPHGRCRERLECLVAAIVRNDTSQGELPFPRIRRLLSRAAQKAWLAEVVPSHLLHTRTEAIASLAIDSEHSVLAMALLDHLSIPEYSFDSAIEGERRTEQYRTNVWLQLLPLFVTALACREVNDQGAADTCVELASYLMRRSTQGGSRPDPRSRAVHNCEARSRIRALTDALSEATFAGRRYLPRALPLMEMALQKIASAENNEARRLALRFWLFGCAVDEIDRPLAGSIALSVANEVVEWLQRDVQGGHLDAWFDEEPQVADLPWERVLLASAGAANRIIDDINLHGKDIGGILQAVAHNTIDDDDGSFDDYQLRSTLLRKRRLWLSMLLRATQRLPTTSRVVVLSPASLKDRLQRRLCSFLAAEACEASNVFSGTPYLSANLELLARTLHVIEGFPEELRRKCTNDWIRTNGDPFLVLGILAETHSNNLRIEAERRFVSIDWEAYFKEQTFWPTMFALARLAVEAGKLDLAEAILEKDASPSPRDRESLLPRLMLASAKGDVPFNVAVPGDFGHEEGDTVAFYRGLHELPTHPTIAVAIYDDLVRRRVHVAASAVNLFSARLRVAQEMTDADERLTAIASALGDWKEIAATIASEERRRIDWDAHQNELYALQQLGLETDFWRQWNDLSNEERASESFIKLAIAATPDSDMDARQRILEHASKSHAAPIPEWLSVLRSEIVAGKSPVLASPRFAQLPDEDIRAAYNEGLRRSVTSRAFIFGNGPDANLDNLLLDLHLNAARELQRQEVSLSQLSEEDKISDFMVGILRAACRPMGITVHSQERGGLSGGDGRSTDRGGVGERDWTVQADAIEVSVAEALQLPSSRDNIQHHLEKLIERYDRTGLPRAFMVLYVRGVDFDKIANTYQEAIRTWTPAETQLIGDIEIHSQPAAYLRVLRTLHRRGEAARTTVFHLLVRIPRKQVIG